VLHARCDRQRDQPDVHRRPGYAGAAFPCRISTFTARPASAEEWADLEPYFDDAVCFVEWPEPGAGVLPAPRLVAELRLQEADARLISLRSEHPELLAAIADSLD
jgi:hypothetical protein